MYMQICSSERRVRNVNYECSLTKKAAVISTISTFYLIAANLPGISCHHLVTTTLLPALWPELRWEVNAFVFLLLFAGV